MEDEKRRSPRAEVDCKCLVILDRRDLAGVLVNVSQHGALVRVRTEGPVEVSELDTESAVSLLIEDGNPTPTLKKGTVCRYLEYRSFKYLAIDFIPGAH